MHDKSIVFVCKLFLLLFLIDICLYWRCNPFHTFQDMAWTSIYLWQLIRLRIYHSIL